jgi:hypothetical protein
MDSSSVEGASSIGTTPSEQKRRSRRAGSAVRYRIMAGIVVRVRLMGGDHMDVTYEDPDVPTEAELIERAVSVLSDGSGALRCRHGDRLLVLYGRGVAAFEVSPRGAII